MKPMWIYRLRGILVSPPLIVALLCFRCEVEEGFLVLGIGISAFALGLVLRIWAQQHLGHRLEVWPQLTTTGPYQIVRNPLYIGNTLLAVGVSAMSELAWLVPVTILWCAGTYSLVVRCEEAMLLHRYGEQYRRYMSGVPRWFPRKLPWRKLELVNQHLVPSILTEIHCLGLLLPYILKEMMSDRFGNSFVWRLWNLP